ncbi:MAG TPA: SDR family oxidoreductase [Thermomicrobiales bacterium]|nr:SDR family oxidoreductase [Thermomicrobiales bacterium]
MRVVVTGGAGFIGSHLCEGLLNDGHEVIILDNFITGRWLNLQDLVNHPRLTVIEHDVIEPIEVDGVDQVFHMASPASPVGYMRHPIETHLVNSVGTLNMLRLAQRAGASFLFTSTSEAYGNPAVHPQTEDYFGNVNPVGPRSCYDESKRFGESITMEFVRQWGFDARIVRIFNTYGPRTDPDDGRVIPSFISLAEERQPVVVFGDGSQTRSLCYVSDLVRGLRLAMDTPGTTGEVINLGNPDERTVMEIATLITRLCGSDAGVRYEPARQDDPERRRPDISKAIRLLGWQPEVGLNVGLRQTVDYFRSVERVTG